MSLLQGFNRLDANTLVAVSTLSSSPDASVAFAAQAVLLKAKTPDSVAKFRQYLEHYKEARPPIGLIGAAGELSLVTNPSARVDLEYLSANS